MGRAPGNIYLLDLLSTCCDLAGIDAPANSEGKSCKPIFTGEQQTVRDVLYGAYCGGTKPGMRCVKKGDWKLIQYDVLNGKVRETQLFNLATNPHEFLTEHHAADVMKLSHAKPSAMQIDLAELDEHADKLAEMKTLLLEEMRRLHDPFRFWNQPNDGLAKPQVDRWTPKEKRAKQNRPNDSQTQR